MKENNNNKNIVIKNGGTGGVAVHLCKEREQHSGILKE